MSINYEIDNVDIGIMNALLKDANTPYTEIAEKLFISPGTVHVRMKKLERYGIVKAPQIQLNTKKLGLDVIAFIGVYLNRSDQYDAVLKEIKKIDEVVSCHYTTGNYSLFLKIVCSDTEHLRKVLHDKMQKITGINRTETLISLEESFERAVVLQPVNSTR
ncbi:MAG: Lrp/AsnC ligand binding domain-containing protein [Chitinophagales bacterium]|jgi:Lrp/AsnC family transcriptional regulator for asnA, asnC and gidA|nr:Lrp/AsnC ligand binding domain-containing protein [Chitinophagales bacterium]